MQSFHLAIHFLSSLLIFLSPVSGQEFPDSAGVRYNIEVIGNGETNIEDDRSLRPRRLDGTPDCPDELTSSVDLHESFDNTLTFHYAVVLSNDPFLSILCVRLESDSEAWLGFGISPNGKMIGSTAVIGLPDEGTVMKYDLKGKSTYIIDRMPWRQQTLMDESIVQEDGRTILTFTKYLLEDDDEMDILANGENIFLYSEAADNVWQYHGNRRGSFTLDFEGVSFDGTSPEIPSTTATTTSATTTTTTTATTTSTSINTGTTTSSKATVESAIPTSDSIGTSSTGMAGNESATTSSTVFANVEINNTTSTIASEVTTEETIDPELNEEVPLISTSSAKSFTSKPLSYLSFGLIAMLWVM